MLRFLTFLFLLGSLAVARAYDAFTETNAPVLEGRVVKVLPLFLDQQGHDAISPSLFERDAYQAQLRKGTNAISGVRFDVLWGAQRAGSEKLKLRAELRGIGAGSLPRVAVLETNVMSGHFRRWTSLTLNGEAWKNFGSLAAWRVTLWNGDQMVGEQKSFLW
jgi:hypothetical protein